MAVCEKCGIELIRYGTKKNVSPSEVHDLCVECWLKHPESKGYRKMIMERMGNELHSPRHI